MKIKVTKSAIESAAVILSKVINTKNPIPILGDILCEVHENVINMTGGDGESSITKCVELLDMEGEGDFCIDGGRLLAALRSIPEQPITITCTTEDDFMFTIQHQDGTMHFLAEHSEEYPVLADEKWNDEGFELQSDRIGAAIKRCLWAVDADDLRPLMCGVHIGTVAKYDSLDIVTSNGAALVRTRLTEWNNHGYNGKMDATIPAKIAKIMADTLTGEEPMRMRFSKNKCQIETDSYTMTCRLIEGAYPKYNSVIPSDNNIEACVDGSTLATAIKRTLPFAPDSSQLLSLHFFATELRVVSADYDFSEGANDRVAVDFNSSSPLAIGVKGSTLLKALGYIPNQGIRIKMSDPSRPVLLEPKDPWNNTEVTILLMPMLLNE